MVSALVTSERRMISRAPYQSCLRAASARWTEWADRSHITWSQYGSLTARMMRSLASGLLTGRGVNTGAGGGALAAVLFGIASAGDLAECGATAFGVPLPDGPERVGCVPLIAGGATVARAMPGLGRTHRLGWLGRASHLGSRLRCGLGFGLRLRAGLGDTFAAAWTGRTLAGARLGNSFGLVRLDGRIHLAGGAGRCRSDSREGLEQLAFGHRLPPRIPLRRASVTSSGFDRAAMAPAVLIGGPLPHAARGSGCGMVSGRPCVRGGRDRSRKSSRSGV